MKKLFLIALLMPCILWAQKKQITLEDIYKLGTFRGESVPGFRSMNNGQFYVEADAKLGLLQKDFVTGNTVSTIVAIDAAQDENAKPLPLDDVSFSADENKVMIAKDREFIYRHSSKAFVYVFDKVTGKTAKVDGEKVMHATFNPKADKVAFVKNNNLFIRDLTTGSIKQMTVDGAWNKIINGNCDWVYEEEFSFTQAYQWSPDGKYIAYYRFDETNVPQFNMPMYEGLYPKDYTYKYPKAGEPNSIIQIHLYEVATGKDIKAFIGDETDMYIPRIQWTPSNQLCIQWMNRMQNELKYLLADPTTGATKTLYTEKNKYYVDITDDLRFLNNGTQFIHTSEKDGFVHAYLYGMDGLQKMDLTAGNYDISSINFVDEKNKLVYYTAALPTPMDRQLFVVDFAGKKRKQITQGNGWHNVSFNSNGQYYVDNYSDLNTPATISIFDKTGKPIKVLKDNASLKAKLVDFDIAKASFMKVANSKGDSLNVTIAKPTNFDPSKKYPVLFSNYGGPGSQEVVNRFGSVNFWHQLLLQKGYVIVKCDNTGTGSRGEEFKKKTYKQMGKFEIEDQIDVAKYFATMPWVDAKRIGHWGWSYGGFMSSLAITKGADVFSAAVAVAPVTNWRYYDNIYTERFMQTPKQNASGYDDNAPEKLVSKIKGKFLIIHGTADDNVHFQNSVMMIDEMIKKNIDFESAYYPNKNHGIRGGNTSLHLYRKMTNWILANL